MTTRLARSFADALVRLHDSQDGARSDRDALARAAERVWDAAHEGHVCVRVANDAEALALARSPALSTETRAAVAPLVLDAARIYLYRLHRAETRLALAASSLDAPGPVASPQAIAQAVTVAYAGADPDEAQRRAVRLALERRLSLISGGPGSGKTTTLARIVIALAEIAPEARVAIAAPTGKAAARLSQSLAAEIGAMPAQRAPGVTRLPVGMTVHALLGLRGQPAGERAEVGAPLPWDAVIVDEASMLDIELASALALRIGPGSRLVLAGDMDQLASVEAGAVFAELCAAGLQCVTRLERNYRQREGAQIVALAAAVRDAAGAEAIAAAFGSTLRSGDDPAAIVASALEAYEGAFAALRPAAQAGAPLDTGASTTLLERYESHRVLCALRDGPRGVVAINAMIAAAVRRRIGAAAHAQWYPGRLVMVLRNDRDARLFNGDVGVCVDGESVVFPDGGGLRRMPVLVVPSCEDAWAITVHKSQGSEFDSVAFVAAPQGHALATRELVYTAVTRARRALSVWGSAQAIAAAASTRVTREGRLAERIAGARAARRSSGAER
ncbi:MAG: exodeoxyribonuclease V subunit alpha [Burkholderiaceae bacterium]|nr:exodeoxyribonuclease V subunit alpha [Burkholderiaceae bacterium]